MNFDKKYISDFFFFFFLGGGGGRGVDRDITLPMFFGIKSKIILKWILNNILNFRILSQANICMLCRQGFSIVILAKSEKGPYSINVLQNLLKN